MADEDFENWKLCFNINLSFQVLTKAGTWQCLGCDTTHTSPNPSYRSNFPIIAAECPAGHNNRLNIEAVGACPSCDQDLVLNISTRKQECFQEGCRRLLVVKEEVVKPRVVASVYEKYVGLLEEHRTFECPVCMVDYPLSEAPSKPPSSKCTHDPNVCSDCVTAMLVAQISGGRWEYIKCPSNDCEEELDGKGIQASTPVDTFRVYNEFVTNRALSQDPNFRWCCGRINDGQESCTWGQLCSGPSTAGWRCIKCNQLNCFACKGPGHPDETCDAYKARQGDGAANERRILQITKKCPKKGCSNQIEKNGGCINMKCPCGINFCWECKVIYGRGNTPCACGMHSLHEGCRRHLKTCSYKRPNAIIDKPTASHPLYQEGWDQDPEYIG
ncbi:uncharacterized protein BDZ99DRAFT_453887 [Mytilinidion resinicola]|uniref:RBR-type E3 ubiquitin transferase n=1 Tax=Mytilinidion resinicola TaxID=574789 RepID=A0A6A6Y5Q6_9PEZI|nr:uncharacterized protein BDZ99DRAFT_453887 [Mytilinidion resinicola]KAF2803117.1 hypothetical protein BDZ99DRAFT_453887 [Mytilinidion resinicola]